MFILVPGCVRRYVLTTPRPTSLSDHVLRAHWSQDAGPDLPGSYLLPAPEAHGGRQDPLAGARPRPDSGPPAHGGSSQVSDAP